MPKTRLDTDEILNPVMRLNPVLMYYEGQFDEGELAKIATAMIQAGQDMLSQLRSDVEFPDNEDSVVISGVEFKKRKGYSYRSLDSTVVKKLFPYDKHPEYYNEEETVVNATVAISIKD